MRDPLEVGRDRPEVDLSGHPVKPVEAGQVHRATVATQCPFAGQIEVMLEVGHGQLAQGAVDRLAVAEAGELAGPDGAPVAVALKDRQDVVFVMHRGQVHDQRRPALHPERRRGQDGTFDAVGRLVPKHPAG